MNTVDSAVVSKIKTWLGSGAIDIFAMPFGGKDTIARQLSELLGGSVIGGGDIIRNTTASDNLNARVSQGELAPTDEYLQIVVPYLSRPEFNDRPLILSAVGRWHGEEPAIVNACDQSGHPLKAVIYIKITEEELWKRWEASQKLKDRGHRADDAHDKIDRRIEEFNSKTLPVIDFYRKTGLLIEVDGIGSRPEVFQGLIQSLSNLVGRGPVGGD